MSWGKKLFGKNIMGEKIALEKMPRKNKQTIAGKIRGAPIFYCLKYQQIDCCNILIGNMFIPIKMLIQQYDKEHETFRIKNP